MKYYLEKYFVAVALLLLYDVTKQLTFENIRVSRRVLWIILLVMKCECSVWWTKLATRQLFTAR